MTFASVWKHEDRPVSIPTQHIVGSEDDATLCGEYIDPFDVDAHGNELWAISPGSPDGYNYCTVCVSMRQQRVLDRARSDVARELGVDESEVF